MERKVFGILEWLAVDDIQTHFDKALMQWILFNMPFSYSSYFHAFKEQIQFYMPVLF